MVKENIVTTSDRGNAVRLLHECYRRHIGLLFGGDEIIAQGPKAALDEAFVAELRAQREALKAAMLKPVVPVSAGDRARAVELATLACQGTGLSAHDLLSLLTAENIADIAAGEISLASLCVAADSIADELRCGRLQLMRRMA